MSLLQRSRPPAEGGGTGTAEASAPELDDGIHRDPSLDDPIAGSTLSQRVVRAASSVLSRGTSRRSFLAKTAVVGSALAVSPVDFLLRPGTAYGYVCGTCGDGWTAFCCTINGGRNSCPPGSFIAGWWKADNAAYCCGAARYIIDCNASCPTSCSCRCSGAACDGRRTCCNQFRYGQCHQEISCYGPVVCRVATCTPPWQYDPACTTSSATDNRTVNHGAPCVPDCSTPPPSPIAQKYAALGGSSGFLGAVVQAEQAVADGRGRYAVYQYGRIYWTSTTGAHEVHGAIVAKHNATSGVYGALGYPVSDEQAVGDGGGRVSIFERGRIYCSFATGAHEVHGAIFDRYNANGGARGSLGYPTADEQAVGDGGGRVSIFERGRIYCSFATGAHEVHGAILEKLLALGDVRGQLGYPITEIYTDGSLRRQRFEHGRLTYDPSNGRVTVD